jgi:hypothetical protein
VWSYNLEMMISQPNQKQHTRSYNQPSWLTASTTAVIGKSINSIFLTQKRSNSSAVLLSRMFISFLITRQRMNSGYICWHTNGRCNINKWTNFLTDKWRLRRSTALSMMRLAQHSGEIYDGVDRFYFW